MTRRAPEPRTSQPTRQECIDAAGEVYARILADPDRAAELRAHRERRAAERAVAATAGTTATKSA